MTQEEEAWKESAIKYISDHINERPEGTWGITIDSYFAGITDYKAALRAEIEKYFHNAMKEKAHQYNGGLIDAYKTCLELLDTVKPLKP